MATIYDHRQFTGVEGHEVDELRAFYQGRDINIFCDRHNKNYPAWQDIVDGASRGWIIQISDDNLRVKQGKGKLEWCNCDTNPHVEGTSSDPQEIDLVKQEITRHKLNPPQDTMNLFEF